MLGISITSGYGVLALSCLCRCEGGWHTSPTISACTHVPPECLRKVLGKLEQVGVLESKRGYKGGFRLAAVDPASLKRQCFFGLEECSDERACAAHTWWSDVQTRTLSFLDSTTFADVAGFEWGQDRLDMRRIDSPPTLKVV